MKAGRYLWLGAVTHCLEQQVSSEIDAEATDSTARRRTAEHGPRIFTWRASIRHIAETNLYIQGRLHQRPAQGVGLGWRET